jgi:phosphotransferase system enzyme I (PtsP)
VHLPLVFDKWIADDFAPLFHHDGVRTLDVGGDKPLPYLPGPTEDNPFLGLRGLRHSLAHPALFAEQLLAIVRVAHEVPVSVMFPMVSEPWEFDEAKALFEDQVEWTRQAKRGLPKKIEYGAMLEVPSLAEMLDQLLPRVAFLSIGTNDLTQFLFAADRADPRLAERYDWLSPAILRFLKRVIDAANAGTFTIADRAYDEDIGVRCAHALPN